VTHPTLAKLTPAEIHERGRRARIMGVPYFGGNPFASDTSIKDFDAWAAKTATWWGGWIEEDNGRDRDVQAHRNGPRFL